MFYRDGWSYEEGCSVRDRVVRGGEEFVVCGF